MIQKADVLSLVLDTRRRPEQLLGNTPDAEINENLSKLFHIQLIMLILF